jgi:hypothetical protein
MTKKTNDQLARIADALERLAPKTKDLPNFNNFSAFMWHMASDYLEPVLLNNTVDISLLKGISLTWSIPFSNEISTVLFKSTGSR